MINTSPINANQRTLLGHLSHNSRWLKTSFLGKIIFLGGASYCSLALLHSDPYNYSSHLTFFLTYWITLFLIQQQMLLFSRPILMLLFACIIIGVVNFFLPPDGIAGNLFLRLRYGAVKTTAFAALSFATLLVVCITRPSDPARFISLFLPKPWAITLVAIPFTIFGALAMTFQDIMLAVRARNIRDKKVLRFKQMIVGISTGLLASALTRSLYLHQSVNFFFNTKSPTNSSLYFGKVSILNFYDLLLASILIPGFLMMIIT